MKSNLNYRHPSDYIRLLENYFSRNYVQGVLFSSQIYHKRVNISQLTDCTKAYSEIIRHLSYLFNVKVLRNPSNIEEGIEVVGRSIMVDQFVVYLIKVMEKVEHNVAREEIINPWKYKVKRSKMIAVYRLSTVNRFTKAILGVDKYIHTNPIFTKEVEDITLKAKETHDLILINEYIKQIPSLKIKKAFSWQVDC